MGFVQVENTWYFRLDPEANMALTVDEVLERIGSMGFYQIQLLLIMSYVEWFVLTFQVMVPTFIAAEPKWMCAPQVNNTACNFTGEFTAVDKRRCDMPRKAWVFTDDFTSVVTQVNKLSQEPITKRTKRVQLSNIPVRAFSQKDLFLV